MNIKKHIPNLITLLNLFSGCIALIFAIDMDFERAFFFVSLGIFLDFFDGFFARLFKVSSPLGLQLDSLADMVTSGLVPGFVMFTMLSNGNPTTSNWIPYLGFIITLGSCYRLANFNIDTRQTDSFIGLPTPANALFILSLPLVMQHTNLEFLYEILKNKWVLLSITALSAYILNAEIPLFSLKIKSFDFSKNKLQLIFLASSVVLLIVFQFLGIPLVILFYVLLSVVNNKMTK
ncbi:CDP-alcohol phosphatidyltransferase family protein [Flavobacterium sp.]|jgi:CDP-diacylglycerol--serine O-phosphatidyltransferase|uniref:CDP-alcohol phosphatidyltransferase family protein n=1 Tax=Flavobacterium sp. TaxID=239 RepID=UPI0037C038CB